MAFLLFILLSLEVIAQTCGGHCAAPSCSGFTQGGCTTGQGCQWIAAKPATCVAPTNAYCYETFTDQTGCNDAPGCSWSGSVTACVPGDNPVVCFYNSSTACVNGCKKSTSGLSCYSSSKRENELCNQRPAANCTKYFNNELTYCKLSGQNCVAMNDAEHDTAYCNARSTSLCTSGGTNCRVSGTTCIPVTFKDRTDEICNGQSETECSSDDSLMYCIWSGGKCEGRTETQTLEAFCALADQLLPVSECVSETDGQCHVVNNHCVVNWSVEEPADFCVSGSNGCNWALSEGYCDSGRDICVPNDCTGLTCNPASTAAGCVTKNAICQSAGLSCSPSGTCPNYCNSVPAEPAKCASIPALAEQCVGNGTCSLKATGVGCTSIAGTDPCPNAPGDDNSGMMFTTPTFLLILFGLLVLFL